MVIEKLNETFICESLGEMDIFMVKSSNIPCIKAGDFILDIISMNTSVKTIEDHINSIVIKHNYDSELIDKDIARFIYRQGLTSDNTKAYRFLKRLWRDNKINNLIP